MNRIKTIHRSVIKTANQKKTQQQFLLLIAFVLLLIFFYSWYKEKLYFSLLIAASPVILFSLFYSRIAFPFLYIWMFIGKILSEITSTVILAIIFFIGIFPVKLFLKKEKPDTGWNNVKDSSNFNEQF